jgi:hypothetical protein
MFLISLDVSVIDVLNLDVLRKPKRMCEPLVQEMDGGDCTTITGEIQ